MKTLLARLALIAVVVGATLAVPAAREASAVATYTLFPTSGPPGTVITFTGTGCLPRSGPDGTFVLATNPAGAFTDQPQVIFESGPDGSFSGSITVPSGTPPGTYGTGIGCFLEEVGWPSQPNLAPFTVTAGPAPELASALLTRADGQIVGLAMFTESATGDVRVTLNASNLPAGAHGFTIHAVGRCDPPSFASAGAHFNPTNRKHGLQTSEGPHAGDLPNLVAASNGTAHFDMVCAPAQRASSTPTAARSWSTPAPTTR
jgi:Cu/Zn superoxide dismutase